MGFQKDDQGHKDQKVSGKNLYQEMKRIMEKEYKNKRKIEQTGLNDDFTITNSRK